MNLEKITEEFNEYVKFCQDAVESLRENPLLQKKIPGAASFREEMISKGLSGDARDIDVIIAKKNELINIKINHTNRVVSDILKVASKIGINADLKKVLEVTARLHDIGRFEYATWNLMYGENYLNQKTKRKYFTNQKYSELLEPIKAKNHSEAGFELIMNKGKIKSLLAKYEFAKVISIAVLHHQDHILTGEFSKEVNKLDDKLMHANLNELLTCSTTFNEAEVQIYAVLTQLIKDVDCLDILYQHLTGEYPVIRPVTTFNKDIRNYDGVVVGKNPLFEFAADYGFTKEQVAEFNGLTVEEANEKDRLALPVYDLKTKKFLIDPSRLVMPADLKEKFFNLERIDLQEINKRLDYNPIVGMWWRLLQFLGNINFTSNLEVIKESGLLDQIYNEFPDEIKPNVKEAFDFAKEYLLTNRGNEIYAENVFKK